MEKNRVRLITYLGLLTALSVVLTRFLSINAWNIRIGFGFVPIAAAAVLFGPIPAGIVAAMGDFLGAVLFPTGAYFPGFTLTAFLMGVVLGLFLYQKQNVMRTAAAVAINQLILGLFVNSLWISILYGAPYPSLLTTRIFQYVIMVPVQVIVILLIAQVVVRNGKKVIA